MAGLPGFRSSFWSRCGARFGSASRQVVEYSVVWCLGYWRPIVFAKLTLDGSTTASSRRSFTPQPLPTALCERQVMHAPDIEKLRRFALTIALITLTYSVAGISLKPDSGISVIGLTFQVSRPLFLPIGLVIASFCSLIRFYYYGLMLKKSPYRVRRDVIDGLHCADSRYIGRRKTWRGIVKRKPVPVYFGPTEFTASIYESDRTKVEAYIASFPEACPKFARARPSLKIQGSESFTEDGEPDGVMYTAKVVIPIRCRIAAIIQDIDYSSPIWLNSISIAAFFYRIWLDGIHA
jgi:hypothetical protein